MFTFSLFISRVIGYEKYTDIREGEKEREKEGEDKIRAIIFNERGAKLSRIFVHVYIKPSTRRNENINRFSDFNSISAQS